MYNFTLNEEEYDILMVLIITKLKEIYAWGFALQSAHRQEEYTKLLYLSHTLKKAKENK